MASKRFKSFHRQLYDSPEDESFMFTLDTVCWRQPKEHNFSDWTIIVKVGDEQTKYNVHKVILGAGQKRSIYFAKIFLSVDVQEVHSKTSEISLEPSSAKAFSAMLDYMYSKDDKLNINTENATALRYLADYFYVPRLAEKVNAFIESNVTTDNLLIYLEQARLYHDEPLVCGLFSTLAANGCDSELLSCKVAQYLQDQDEEVSSEVFYSLTAYETMSIISPEYALFFLNLSDKYHCDESNQRKESLESRCAEAFSRKTNLSDIFNETDKNSKEKNKSEYNSLSSKTRLEFLEKVIHCQSEGKGALEEEIKSLKELEFISIFGAGTESVNGWYYPNGKYSQGRKIYTKEGGWEGKEGLFVIHQQPNQFWYVSFRPNGENHETETNIYKCKYKSENFGGINGWKVFGAIGKNPPPTIQRHTFGSIYHGVRSIPSLGRCAGNLYSSSSSLSSSRG